MQSKLNHFSCVCFFLHTTLVWKHETGILIAVTYPYHGRWEVSLKMKRFGEHFHDPSMTHGCLLVYREMATDNVFLSVALSLQKYYITCCNFFSPSHFIFSPGVQKAKINTSEIHGYWLNINERRIRGILYFCVCSGVI